MSTELSDPFFDIIIAEDEPITRKRMTAILGGMGHPIRAFANGLEAWESFNESPARLIISDWLMPEMDGTELCRKVRKRENTQYTYFILVTGERTEESDYDDATNAGTDDFLPKPISRDSIWRRLRVAKRILGFTQQIRLLEQLIPICSYCKQIREEGESWGSVEAYIHTRTGSQFTHGVCPDCYERIMKELDNTDPAVSGKIYPTTHE